MMLLNLSFGDLRLVGEFIIEMLRGKGEETKVLGLTTEVNLGMKWLL
jgi:hypothetical protein